MNRILLAIIVLIMIILGYAIEDAVSDVTSSGVQLIRRVTTRN